MNIKAARILVVDDHHTNLLKMEMSVKRLGYEPTLAESGQEALAALRNENYDLVLLDIVRHSLGYGSIR